jgi:hypothetical protein
MHPTKFRFIWQSSFRGEDFLEINQSETRIVCGGHVCKRIGTKWAIFMWNLVGSFYGRSSTRLLILSRSINKHGHHKQFLFLIGRFKKIFSSEAAYKNCLWWPCLLTDRDKMSNIYRGHDIDASYQVSVHFAKRFQRRRFFRNQPIRKKNCLWNSSPL